MARVSPKAAGAVLALAASLVVAWEGYSPTPYKDVLAIPTVCWGHARAEDRTYTRAECKALLDADLQAAYSSVARCIHVPLKDNEAAALTDAVYNIGPAVVCGSTLQKLANADVDAGIWCRQLLRWDLAGGRKVRGLTRRREAEYRLCAGVE